MKSLRRLLPVLLLACAFVLLAQNNGTIHGTIKSNKGEPIASAAITLINVKMGSSQNVLSASDGGFAASNVAPGNYRVEVVVPGYKKAVVEDFELTATSPAAVDVTLEPGDGSESVQVKGYSSPLQDRSAESSRSYSGDFIRELPLLSRNHQQTVELMPGITPPVPAVPAVVDPQGNRLWQADGSPAISNYHGFDGVQNDDPTMRLATHVPPITAVEDFRVITSDYDAARGRAGGSTVQVLTRSGDNGLHGELFEYNSNSYVQSRNYFDPKPNPQARYNRNQFGVAIGAPIRRDHTFFFGSWEGDYLRQQIPAVTTVPTPAMRSGDFSAVPGLAIYDPATGLSSGAGRLQFPNNMIPMGRLDRVSQALLGAIPMPNRPGLEGNYGANVPFVNDSQRFDARIDQHFSDRDSIFVRYGYTNGVATQNSILGPLGTGFDGRLRSDSAVIGATHVFSPSLFSELRIGYSRFDDTIRNIGGVNALSGGFSGPGGIAPGNGTTPFIQIDGMASLGQFPSYPTHNTEGTFNLVNSWNKTWNRHEIRWGGDIWWTRFDGFENLPFGTQGAFLFTPGATSRPGASLGSFGNFGNSFAAFLLGAPTVSGIQGPAVRPSNLMTSVAGFLADTFRVTERLTLNLGLRYDFFTPVQPRSSAGVMIYNPVTNSLLPTNVNGVDARGNVAYQDRNFSPHVGFAYRIMDRTVFRGGYAISYWNAPLQFAEASFITSNPGVQNGVNGTYGVAGPFGTLPAVPAFGAGLAPNTPLSYIKTTMPTPYVQNYSFMVQHDFGQGTMLDLGYVGTLGRHHPYTREVNAAAPGTGLAGLPLNGSFGRLASTLERGTDLTSNYNAAQVNLTRRFSKGLTLAAAYTYSRAFDYGNGLDAFLNNLSIRSNYGPSDFDRSHVVTISHAWELPFGKGKWLANEGWASRLLGSWSLNGIFRYASGLPFTPIASPVICNCPGNTGRADVATAAISVPYPFAPALPVTANSLGFAEPAAGTFGNIGRNVARGQGFVDYDLAVARRLSVYERLKFELRGEAYNIANSPHFALPVANVNSGTFGQSLSTIPGLGARTIQFALRAIF